MKSPSNLQILAITNRIKTGKAKSPDKAKAKIRQIKQRAAWHDHLAM